MKKVALTADTRAVPAASDVNTTRVGKVRSEQHKYFLDFNAVRIIPFFRKFVMSGIMHSVCQTSHSKRKWLQYQKIIV